MSRDFYLFLHGWSFSKDIWKQYYNFSNSLFANLPFHNDFNEFKYNGSIINSFVDYLENKLKGKKSITIIGWSLGASISVLLALRFRKNLKKLILIGFSPKFNDENLGHNPKLIKAFLLSLRKDFRKTVYRFRKTAVGNQFGNIPCPDKEYGYLLLKEFIDLDLRDTIKEIDRETVIIHGKQDKIINPKASLFTNQAIYNSRLFLVDSHHAPFLTHPDIINTNI